MFIRGIATASMEGYILRLSPAASTPLARVSRCLYSPDLHLFTAFVGANLLQSAFTKWCLMEDILHKLGVPKTG